ncbi:hypothetical protein OUZ56_005102 [Daphnia magna]|uniref:Uncharacterized protein n=1 Tax=Daphnia magna TaxID=35525 RepID=A0ABQ9YRU0_9CRUS|nr:hypothetical protein OUZ56_005102 [Daphnia magna]
MTQPIPEFTTSTNQPSNLSLVKSAQNSASTYVFTQNKGMLRINFKLRNTQKEGENIAVDLMTG